MCQTSPGRYSHAPSGTTPGSLVHSWRATEILLTEAAGASAPGVREDLAPGNMRRSLPLRKLAVATCCGDWARRDSMDGTLLDVRQVTSLAEATPMALVTQEATLTEAGVAGTAEAVGEVVVAGMVEEGAVAVMGEAAVAEATGEASRGARRAPQSPCRNT